jgi:hypothetical protein
MLNPQDQELHLLLERYRAACPDPEPSADFMPGLWRRIEGRQHVSRRFLRIAQGFVTAAAMICLLLTGVVLTQAGFSDSRTYVEALDDDSDDFTEVAALPASFEKAR